VGVLRLLHRAAVRQPQALAHLLQALSFHLSPVREVALVAPSENGGPDALADLTAVVRSAHRPNLVLAGGPEGTQSPELMLERHAVEGRPAAYVCENFACRAPVTEPDELAAALGDR
jgi:uncharacterized protein YyaL (SSP411 family)